MSDHDITRLLEEWEFDRKHSVRIIAAADGRSVMQVRLPLGIEQYELEGRPDRRRPYGHETVLASIEDALRQHVVDHGSDAGFEISTDQAAELQEEGILFYNRYLLLFQIRHFDLVVRDTEHNVHLCDILERYCGDEDARNAVLQFRPYILRMNAAAQAMAISEGLNDGSPHEVIERTIATIEDLDEIPSPAFQLERVRSVSYLRSLLRSLDSEQTGAPTDDRGDVPRDPQAELRAELQEAVDHEDYERAARIRDQLRNTGPGDGDVDKDS